VFVLNFSEKHKVGKRGEKGREIEIEREREMNEDKEY
jgi:hypothetical protein